MRVSLVASTWVAAPRRAALAVTAFALTIAAVASCGALRDGPGPDVVDGDASAPRDGALVEETSTSADGPSRTPPEHDREWAMWRLPRSAPPADNYSVAGGVVRDETTRLEWMREAIDELTHAEAESACASATRMSVGAPNAK